MNEIIAKLKEMKEKSIDILFGDTDIDDIPDIIYELDDDFEEVIEALREKFEDMDYHD